MLDESTHPESNPPSAGIGLYDLGRAFWRWLNDWLAPVLIAAGVMLVGIIIIVNLLSSSPFS